MGNRRDLRAIGLGFGCLYPELSLAGVPLALTVLATYLPLNLLKVKMILTKHYHSEVLTCFLSIAF